MDILFWSKASVESKESNVFVAKHPWMLHKTPEYCVQDGNKCQAEQKIVDRLQRPMQPK
jgi:hypothetical protein